MERRVEIEVGGKPLKIETGKIAKQADGSAVVRLGDTVVLVTACFQKKPREGGDFLPLTVITEKLLMLRARYQEDFLSAKENQPKKKF